MKIVELDKNDLKVVKFIYYGGDSYNPPGYYAYLAHDGQVYNVLVSMDNGQKVTLNANRDH